MAVAGRSLGPDFLLQKITILWIPPVHLRRLTRTALLFSERRLRAVRDAAARRHLRCYGELRAPQQGRLP